MLRGSPKERFTVDCWVFTFLTLVGFVLYVAIISTEPDSGGPPPMRGFYCNGKVYSTMQEVVADWED